MNPRRSRITHVAAQLFELVEAEVLTPHGCQAFLARGAAGSFAGGLRLRPVDDADVSVALHVMQIARQGLGQRRRAVQCIIGTVRKSRPEVFRRIACHVLEDITFLEARGDFLDDRRSQRGVQGVCSGGDRLLSRSGRGQQEKCEK